MILCFTGSRWCCCSRHRPPTVGTTLIWSAQIGSEYILLNAQTPPPSVLFSVSPLPVAPSLSSRVAATRLPTRSFLACPRCRLLTRSFFVLFVFRNHLFSSPCIFTNPAFLRDFAQQLLLTCVCTPPRLSTRATVSSNFYSQTIANGDILLPSCTHLPQLVSTSNPVSKVHPEKKL